MLIACDGLWKRFDNESAIEYINKILEVGTLLTEDVDVLFCLIFKLFVDLLVKLVPVLYRSDKWKSRFITTYGDSTDSPSISINTI